MARRRRPPRPGALADLAPLRILKQILLLQTSYYLCAGILITFTALVAGKDLSLDLLLSWESIRGDITVGWMLGLVWMLNSLISVIPILLLIARSKLVPDFALTIHLIHLIVTSFYSGSVPRHWFWWGLQVLSAGLMTILGMWSCQWRELRPISFGGHKKAEGVGNNNATTGATREDGAGQRGDEEQGFERGRGRGRGRDGAGTYEMVGMRDGDGGT